MKCTLTDTTTSLTKCSQHSTSLQSDLTDSQSRLNQCNTNFKNSQSTIITLQQTIENVQNINIKLTTESAKWKLDWETSQNENAVCRSNLYELNITITNINVKLNSCEDKSHAGAQEINTIKNSFDELKKKFGILEGDNCKLTEELNACRADDTADSIEIQKEIAALRAAQELLNQCNIRSTGFEESYKSERDIVINLTNQINIIRGEYAESCKKYEERINILIININEYQTSIKTQTDIVFNLNIRITEITTQLNVSLKVSTLFWKFVNRPSLWAGKPKIYLSE